jgi:ferredoxin
MRYPKVNSFSGALLDIHDLVNPRLTIMDAVVAMEGDGPTGGDPRHVGAILASDDSLACDVVAAWLVGLDPLEVSTIQMAVDQGRIDSGWGDIDVVGDPIASLRVKDFRPASTRLMRTPLYNRLVDILGHWISPHPAVGEGCTSCGTCASNCPSEAIFIQHGGARIDHSQCIRCFCCQELCPERAITIHYPRLTRRWATLV